MKSLIARARSFWRGFRRPEQLEAEMDEEMRFHIAMETTLILGGVMAVMLVVGLGAAAGPARRGLAIQPMDALRDE